MFATRESEKSGREEQKIEGQKKSCGTERWMDRGSSDKLRYIRVRDGQRKLLLLI
jgi:hypothetical protein